MVKHELIKLIKKVTFEVFLKEYQEYLKMFVCFVNDVSQNFTTSDNPNPTKFKSYKQIQKGQQNKARKTRSYKDKLKTHYYVKWSLLVLHPMILN